MPSGLNLMLLPPNLTEKCGVFLACFSSSFLFVINQETRVFYDSQR